jgi:hypothetical protein
VSASALAKKEGRIQRAAKKAHAQRKTRITLNCLMVGDDEIGMEDVFIRRKVTRGRWKFSHVAKKKIGHFKFEIINTIT